MFVPDEHFSFFPGRACGDEAIVYVRFSKVGSTTIRKGVLQHTAELNPGCAWADAGSTLRRGNETLLKVFTGNPDSHMVTRGDLIQGKFGICEPIRRSQPCKYFTALRHPIHTVLSGYQFFATMEKRNKAARLKCFAKRSAH